MKLLSNRETDVLRGALAFMPWDPLKELPAEVDCTVSVLRADGQVLQDAVRHTSGLYGFLRLRSGSYQVLIQPASRAFLPSRRSITVPLPKDASVIIPAPLRPSASYPVLGGATVLRGTVHWRRTQVTPARWAAIFARIEMYKNATWRLVHAMWTRTDSNGEFAAFLRAASPGSEGTRDPLRVIVEIYARPPMTGLEGEDDLSDLVSDDGSDDDVRKRQPLARTPIVIDQDVIPGATLSLNRDEYMIQSDGMTQAMKHRVILLS